MPELSYPLWSSAPEPALLASRDRAGGELVFPALPPSSPLADRHERLGRIARVRVVTGSTLRSRLRHKEGQCSTSPHSTSRSG